MSERTENTSAPVDDKSRKWLLTINNPSKYNMLHEDIKNILENFTLVYWCMSDEIGESGTYHTHLYLQSKNAIRFSKIKKYFSCAHIDKANGTAQNNRDYITKEGKWSETEKAETSVEGTFEEFGEVPSEKQGKRNDIELLYNMVKDGLTNFEILESNPKYLTRLTDIERTRLILKEEQYKNQIRDINCTYVYGTTGSGKTRYVMEKYGFPNVYRVTDYSHPFDGYQGQEVIIFEEFRSSLKIQDMLNYLDIYPLVLPCRYANKQACYTQIYIISNWELLKQYENIQSDSLETYKAFLRRINNVLYFDSSGHVDITNLAKNARTENPTAPIIQAFA